MREERLLERLRIWDREPERRAKNDPKKIVDSVIRHLQRILNTRQGNVPIAEDYGVPDFTDFLHSYPESLREIEKTIRQTIQKYEPRLRAVRVNFIPQDDDVLSLRFQIMAKLSVDEGKTPVFIETLVDSEGKVNINKLSG
jgi:type VI secretion system protein